MSKQFLKSTNSRKVRNPKREGCVPFKVYTLEPERKRSRIVQKVIEIYYIVQKVTKM